MMIPHTFEGLSGLGTTTSQSQVAQMVVQAANQYGVPPNLALGIASHESAFNPNATNLNTNGTRDWGVMQLNDMTVKSLGVSNPLDPQQNIDAGVGLLAKYLQQYNGDSAKALQAYASGPGSVSSGSGPNATASQFITYVQSYTPPSSLIDLQTPSQTVAVDDTTGMPVIDPSAGEGVDWGTIGLVAVAAFGLMMLMD